jgi:hypothetical protein
MAGRLSITPMTGNKKVYNPGKDVKGKGAKKAVKKAVRTVARADVDVEKSNFMSKSTSKKVDKAEDTLRKYKTPGRVYGKKLDKATQDLRKARGTNRKSPIPRIGRSKSRRGLN